MVISEIQSDIQALEENDTLYEETNFDCRADAIDFIDFHIIDRIEGLLQKTELKKKIYILKQRTEKLKCKLKEIDTNLFEQLREKIRKGICTKSSFQQMILKYTGYHISDIDRSDSVGYDNLDVFIDGLLSNQFIPEETMEREPEMVFYQKTPARIIFEMIELAELREGDVFFDIGSGLGQVAILVHLVSGVTARGIEYEPAYCNYAQACVSRLNLSNVEFISTDARKADYSEGTVFFMYTPFEGSMLQDMLEILQKQSQKKVIRIFTYGPCSSHAGRQNWLNCLNGNAGNLYKLYEFKSLDAKLD